MTCAIRRQHHVGVFEIVGVLTVIVQHRVIEGVDALEILGIQGVLGADPRLRFAAEIGLKQLQHRPEDRKIRHAEIAAGFLEPARQVLFQKV